MATENLLPAPLGGEFKKAVEGAADDALLAQLAPERDAGALVRDSLIEIWWAEQLANHPALRATDLYNPLRQAVTDLKARLG